MTHSSVVVKNRVKFWLTCFFCLDTVCSTIDGIFLRSDFWHLFAKFSKKWPQYMGQHKAKRGQFEFKWTNLKKRSTGCLGRPNWPTRGTELHSKAKWCTQQATGFVPSAPATDPNTAPQTFKCLIEIIFLIFGAPGELFWFNLGFWGAAAQSWVPPPFNRARLPIMGAFKHGRLQALKAYCRAISLPRTWKGRLAWKRRLYFPFALPTLQRFSFFLIV